MLELATTSYTKSIENLQAHFGVERREPLSSVPSRAIEQICDDLQSLPANVKYNGDTWVTACDEECEVCLAGITMLTGRCGLREPEAQVFRADKGCSKDSTVKAPRLDLNPIYYLDVRHVALNVLRTNHWNAPNGFREHWAYWLRITYRDNFEMRELADSIENASLTAEVVTQVTGYQGLRSVDDLPKLRRVAALCKLVGF